MPQIINTEGKVMENKEGMCKFLTTNEEAKETPLDLETERGLLKNLVSQMDEKQFEWFTSQMRLLLFE